MKTFIGASRWRLWPPVGLVGGFGSTPAQGASARKQAEAKTPDNVLL
jgi:hypothetical protein